MPLVPMYYVGTTASMFLFRPNEAFLEDTYDDPQWVAEMCDLATEWAINWIGAQYDAGCNSVCFTAETMGTLMLSPKMCIEFNLPCIKKLDKNPELLMEMPRFRRFRLRGQLKKTKPLVDALEAIAVEHEATIAQIVLNWTVNYHGDTIVSIPGATKTYQAKDNANAMRLSLTKEQMETISSLSHECL